MVGFLFFFYVFERNRGYHIQVLAAFVITIMLADTSNFEVAGKRV